MRASVARAQVTCAAAAPINAMMNATLRSQVPVGGSHDGQQANHHDAQDPMRDAVQRGRTSSSASCPTRLASRTGGAAASVGSPRVRCAACATTKRTFTTMGHREHQNHPECSNSDISDDRIGSAIVMAFIHLVTVSAVVAAPMMSSRNGPHAPRSNHSSHPSVKWETSAAITP